MSATVTRLFGRPATYTTSDFSPNVSETVRTYGPVTDDMIREFAAQQHGGQPADYDITRPAAA